MHIKQAQLIARVVKPAIFCIAVLPLGMLVWDGFHDGLGANPVEEITWRTGGWGLRLLLITLCVTPLRHLTGWAAIIRVRRMLGLFAFFYLCLHFLTYIWLDAYFDLTYIADDIVDRVYITAGFASFLALVPLALTSTDNMVRRLGPRRWRGLHRLAYAAALGGTLHFLWQVKADLREPLIYLLMLTVLLGLRLPGITSRLGRVRQAGRGRTSAHASPCKPAGGVEALSANSE